MSRANVTPTQALSRLLAAAKQINADECKDERVFQALQGEIGVAEGVLRDYVEPEVDQLLARLDAKETRNKMLLSELDALSARYFHDGVPPAHFGKEWFIAVMDDGDKVVLRLLDEENAYDYTTMDATYFKAYRVKKWMQFPDSQYITYGGAAPIAAQSAVAAASVLDGWQWVPIEPTDAMLDVMHKSIRIHCIPSLGEANILNDKDVYTSMLAAAPLHEAGNAAAGQEPIGYLRQSEIDKMADLRVAGVGMMLHKESGEGKVAVYLATPSIAAPTEVERDAVQMPRPCSHCTGGKVKSGLTMMEQPCHICAGTGLIWPNRGVIAAIATGEKK